MRFLDGAAYGHHLVQSLQGSPVFSEILIRRPVDEAQIDRVQPELGFTLLEGLQGLVARGIWNAPNPI
jgi:hypothetical protein